MDTTMQTMPQKTRQTQPLRFVELFAGIGGFRLGIEKAIPNAQCVYANDFDKYAAQTYEKNFCNRINTETRSDNGGTESDIRVSNGDGGRSCSHCGTRECNGGVDTRSITDVSESDIPDHDLLVGGFPCQAFSIAGKRAGFNDTRGTLFFDIARIIKKKRTKYLLLENVKGLLSHDSGRTFKTILSTLTELGYDIQTMVLNSKNFGVPQNRERVFIIGNLRGESRPKIFPFGESNPNDIEQLNNPKHSNKRIYGKAGISPTLNTAQGGNRQPKIIQRINSSQDGKLADINGVSQTLSAGHYNQPKIIAKTVRSGGRKSPHGSKQNWDSYEFDGKIRRLTPMECERLQGFPDNWTEGVSDTQRYKQLGNAVTVNVVQEIMKRFST